VKSQQPEVAGHQCVYSSGIVFSMQSGSLYQWLTYNNGICYEDCKYLVYLTVISELY
jgi:hypothetical protein